MKIVINTCYGGFGLSDEAETLYANKKDFSITRYKQTKHKHTDKEDEYTRINSGDGGMFSFTFTKDHGETFKEWPEDATYWYSNEIERDDPVLVEVVEELGEKANGDYASLEVVEIPDDVSYEISEYDGSEHISETHRTWG